MTQSQKYQTLALLGVALLAATVLAAGLSSFELQPGRSLPVNAFIEALRQWRSGFTGPGPLPFDPFRWLAVVLWVGLIAAVILFILSPEFRREMLRRIIIYLIWALLIYGAIAVIQPLISLPEQIETPQSAELLGEAAGNDEPLPPVPAYVVNPPGWLVTLVSVLLATGALLLAWLAWKIFFPKTEVPAEPLAEISRSAQSALDALDAGGDVQDTVLRCYRDMSRTLRDSRHLERQQGMTPREFEAYLARSGLRTEHIHRLTRLFEAVRYGGKSAGRRGEREARECLAEIVRATGGGA